MHDSTFKYLKPTEGQLLVMNRMREGFADLAGSVEATLPDGPDKDYVIVLLRTAAMWANVSITRHPDGSPRAPGSVGG